MRLIDADLFIERVMDGTYVYLQANKEDIVDAINSEATIKIPDFCEKCGADMRVNSNGDK